VAIWRSNLARTLGGAWCPQPQPVIGEMLKDRVQMGEELGECSHRGQLLCGELRLNIGVGILRVRLWREFQTGYRLAMQLELQPPHVHLWVIRNATGSSALLQQHAIALVMAFLALSGLVVEARHQRFATAKAIAEAGIAFVEGMPQRAPWADEATLLSS
jgi:hypothetical protein